MGRARGVPRHRSVAHGPLPGHAAPLPGSCRVTARLPTVLCQGRPVFAACIDSALRNAPAPVGRSPRAPGPVFSRSMHRDAARQAPGDRQPHLGRASGAASPWAMHGATTAGGSARDGRPWPGRAAAHGDGRQRPVAGVDPARPQRHAGAPRRGALSCGWRPPVVPSRTPTGGDVRRGLRAEIAQLVEHATENRGVGSSSLPLGTTTPDAVIERKWLSW